MTKLKFCLVGTHIQQYTGYSKVTYEIVKELSQNNSIDLYHFGFQKAQTPKDYRSYPVGVNHVNAAEKEHLKNRQIIDNIQKKINETEDKGEKSKLENEKMKVVQSQKGFGFNVFREYIETIKPDIIFIYNDIGVITQFVIQLNGMQKTFKLWIYYDQVYEYTHPRMLSIINQTCDKIFYFTKDWEKYGKSQGIVVDSGVILHGLNSKMFYQLEVDEISRYRKTLGFKDNDFIIFNLNRNTGRKRYDILAIAFAEFVSRHQSDDNIYLLVSTNPDGSQGGWKFIEIYHEELRRRNCLTEKNVSKLKVVKNHMRHTDTDINVLYNISDVGINTADGEGYGLCNFEHAATGRPQIVGNYGGFTEFFHKTNTYMVDHKLEYYMPSGRDGLGGRSKVLDPMDVADGLDFYYLHPEIRKLHGKAVKEMVLTYNWKKALKGLTDSIQIILDEPTNNVISSLIKDEEKNEIIE